MTFKKTSLLLIIAAFISISSVTTLSQSIYAVAASDWQSGNIIDDYLFIDSESMSVTQIQSFLNNKVGTGTNGVPGQCDTNGVRTSELGGGTRAQYGAAHSNPAPFTCLKDYYEVPKTVPGPGIPANNYGGKPIPTGAKSAAQLIWDAAQKYSISPKVLLVKLGTESAGPLTSDDWPFLKQYTYAMGSHCPDSGPGGSANCDTDYSGFSIQISSAAALLRYYLDNMDQSWWPYKKPYQTNSILWNIQESGCGAGNVFIETNATAALYTYTPYQPNQAALNNMYGAGDSCSAYGNRNFWRTYSDWFGSTKYPQPIGAMIYRQSSTGKIFLVTNNKRYYIPSNAIMANYGIDIYQTIPASDDQIALTIDGGRLTNMIRDGAGKIYLVNNGYRHYIPSTATCTNWAISCSDTNAVRSLGSAFTNVYLKSGTTLSSTAYYDGVYYEMSLGTRLPYADSKSFTDSGFSTSTAINANPININQPIGKLQLTTAGIIKFAPKNTIYYFNGTDYYIVPSMSVYRTWNLGSINTISAPISTYNTTDNPVVTGSLDISYAGTSGQKYVVSDGTRYPISNTQASLWTTQSYQNGLDSLGSSLKLGTLVGFVKNGVNIYKMSSQGTKDPVPTFADYYRLGGSSSNITVINNQLSSMIPTGPVALASGQLVKINYSSSLYVTDGEGLIAIPDMNTLRAYNFKSAGLYDSVLFISHYPILGTLGITIDSNNTTYIPYNGTLISLTSKQADDFGFKPKDNPIIVDNNFTVSSTIKSTTNFLRNIDNGNIYYASGHALHYIATIDALIRFGGDSTTMTAVNSAVLDNFAIGKALL